jgi:hypothetical protein
MPGIIVKKLNDAILTTDDPVTNTEPDIVLKFSGVFSSYTNEELNEFKAMIYNCLLNQNDLLIQRSIQLYAGSIVADMVTNGVDNAYSSLINTLNGGFSLGSGVSLANAAVKSVTLNLGAGENTTSIPDTTLDISVTTPDISVTTPDISVTTPDISVTTPDISVTTPDISVTTTKPVTMQPIPPISPVPSSGGYGVVFLNYIFFIFYMLVDFIIIF